jgi:hypothetical protein
MKQRIVNTFRIADDQWSVYELTPPHENNIYIIYKNGDIYHDLAGGGQYETETGAYYAIINEYKVKVIK